jgi:Na+/proline symporter
MVIWEFLFVLLLAGIITALLAGSGRRFGPGEGIIAFFFIVLLFSWAGGLWLAPFGPLYMGIYWLPYLFMGVIIALLLAALIPPRQPHTMKEADERATEADIVAASAFSVFFWIFLLVLILAILAGYLI